MKFSEFSVEYKVARARVRETGGKALDAEQQRLRDLVPALTTDEDRRVASSLAEHLPERAAPPAPPSPLLTEALRIQESAFFSGGTKEERLTILSAARRRIQELADRAGKEGPTIRGLTRTLEHRENQLTDPQPWEDPQPSGEPSTPDH
jgi:hypothetical protein